MSTTGYAVSGNCTAKLVRVMYISQYGLVSKSDQVQTISVISSSNYMFPFFQFTWQRAKIGVSKYLSQCTT